MKTALVTGASRGIGRATAVSLAKDGYSVAINFKANLNEARSTLAECNKHSEKNVLVQCDVSNEENVKEMLDVVKSHFGSLTVLVNNAGIFHEGDSHTNIDAFESIYRNNFLSCVLVTKYTLPLMKAGKIINVSSISGRLGQGRPKSIAYSAFKAAMDSYTKTLAKELAPKILVNAIAPGRVATDMWGNPDDKAKTELGEAHLIKRMIEPEEIADAVMFLVKNDAMCGEILTIDGGYGICGH